MRDFQKPGRSLVLAANGMCATSHPLAAKTAINILEDGGNAVDAAIGCAVLLGICEPMMTGIGGDCFVLLKPAAEDKIVALNGSGRAPAALSAEKLRATGQLEIGLQSADAVTVPGAVDAFCRLSDDWGHLGLAASLAPAIDYARSGVPVAPRTARDWQVYQSTLQGHARRFYLKNDKPLEMGDNFCHPQQADVLQAIAQHGRAAFYEGDIAQDMVTALNAAGGCHTARDFAETSATYTDPISGSYKGMELVEHPPNGQGATAILIANMLAHFDLSTMTPFGVQRTHLETEIAKLAYDARDRFLADPDHTTRLPHMLDLDTARQLAGLVDMRRAMAEPNVAGANVHKETVYLTVVDKDRMAVSMIYSIFHAFGSGIASSKYGILMQNRGTGFTLQAGHPNEAMGGKRPMHTIIPGMLRKSGKLIMPFGVMGGAYQPNGHVRFLSNMVDFGMDPQTAIDGPRSFADAGTLKLESGYSDDVRQGLRDLGHNVQVPHGPLGGAQAILIDHEKGCLIGASDPRKDGAAIGY